MGRPPVAPVDLELLGQALDASINSAVIADAQRPDMPIIYVNPAFERLSGYPAADILGRNCRFLQGDEPNEAARAEIRAAITEGRSVTTLLRNLRPDGQLFCNELTISPVRDAAGTVTHYFGFQSDVTVRETMSALMTRLQGVTENLAAAQTEEQAFGIILGEALDAIGAVGGAALLLRGNHLHIAARRGDGVWQDGELSRSVPAASALRSGRPVFVRHSDLPAPGRAGGARETGVLTGPDERAVAGTPQPSAGTVASAVLPMQGGGQPLGVLILEFREPHDFAPDERYFLSTLASQCALALSRIHFAATLERQVRDRTAELQAQRDLLQAANEALAAFTHSVSHDLRTPVRHINSFLDLLRRALPPSPGEKPERYLEVIGAAAAQLVRLIDGMAAFPPSASQPIRARPVELGQLVTAARQDVTPETGRQIAWKIGPLPTVVADPDLLRQVITALLDNAVKFTRPRPEAVIEVWANDAGAFWELRVRDNGVGFPAEYGDRLFALFQRLHRHEEFEGAGVGLASVRQIVLRHGGAVMAESETGVGATFGFTLPKTQMGSL